MVLLSAEKGLKAEEIAGIVRESHITVLRWLKPTEAIFESQKKRYIK